VKPVYLALGSNLGDREAHLRAGIHALAKHQMEIVKQASIYSTEPREVLDQPWFLNTAIEAATDLQPDALLRVCLEIEKDHRRVRDMDKGPRTLDIDIIFYGSEVIHAPGLTIPHPSFASRRFVLTPLVEIAPDFVDPVTRKTLRKLLESCDDQSEVTRLVLKNH
jgi:2-amino-4-hydroxy-6-hydroxymethyldihydropteridine diphosphokinase